MPVGDLSNLSGFEALANITFKLANPDIKKVIFNDPATIVYWSDNSRTVVKCQDGDTYSKEQGLAMCIAKKYLGNKGNFNEVFKKFIGDEYTHGESKPDAKTLLTMRQKLDDYCKERPCSKCKVSEVIPSCGVGSHISYTNPKHHSYIEDNEIVKAYKCVFSEEV